MLTPRTAKSQIGISIEGPSKAEVSCHDKGDGCCEVTWSVCEVGEYFVHIHVNGNEMQQSPYKVSF